MFKRHSSGWLSSRHNDDLQSSLNALRIVFQATYGLQHVPDAYGRTVGEGLRRAHHIGPVGRGVGWTVWRVGKKMGNFIRQRRPGRRRPSSVARVYTLQSTFALTAVCCGKTVANRLPNVPVRCCPPLSTGRGSARRRRRKHDIYRTNRLA